MATRTTRWSPDTCRCVIDLEWDDTEADTSRTHNYTIVSKCDIHAALSGVELRNAILGENSGKNQIYKKIVDRLTVLGISGVERDDITWSFDQDRKIILNVRGISAADRDVIIASLTPTQLTRLSAINIVS